MSETTPEKKMIVLDLGRQGRKKVGRLRKGKGPLMDDIQQGLQEFQQSGTIPADSPVVIAVVRERRKRKLFRMFG